MGPHGRVAGEFKSPLRHSKTLVLQRSRSEFGRFANRLLTGDRVLVPKGALQRTRASYPTSRDWSGLVSMDGCGPLCRVGTTRLPRIRPDRWAVGDLKSPLRPPEAFAHHTATSVSSVAVASGAPGSSPSASTRRCRSDNSRLKRRWSAAGFVRSAIWSGRGPPLKATAQPLSRTNSRSGFGLSEGA